MAKTATRTASPAAPILGSNLGDATNSTSTAPAPAPAPTVEEIRAAALEVLANKCATTAQTLWAQADALRKDAKTRTADVYRSLRIAQTGEGQSPSEGAKTLDAAIMALAKLRAGDVPKQVMPNAQSIRTTYARALINPMMGESDKVLIKGWILAGNALRSGAAEALYKRAEGFGVDLS